MKQQTAVEWLVETLEDNSINLDLAFEIIEEAKELEKQQIIDAREDGYNSTYNSCESGCGGNLILESTNEKYYEQTFKK
jgi:hypothetical protein